MCKLFNFTLPTTFVVNRVSSFKIKRRCCYFRSPISILMASYLFSICVKIKFVLWGCPCGMECTSQQDFFLFTVLRGTTKETVLYLVYVFKVQSTYFLQHWTLSLTLLILHSQSQKRLQ